MDNYNIRKNLFDKWKSIGSKISLMGNIVQNDITYTDNDINEWTKNLSRLITELTEIADDTMSFIINKKN